MQLKFPPQAPLHHLKLPQMYVSNDQRQSKSYQVMPLNLKLSVDFVQALFLFQSLKFSLNRDFILQHRYLIKIMQELYSYDHYPH